MSAKSGDWRLERRGHVVGWSVVSCTLMQETLDSAITRSLGPYGAGLRAWPGQDRRPYVVLDISSDRTHSLVYIKIY